MDNHLAIAREVFQIEAMGLQQVSGNLTADFSHAVETMLSCKGKVIVTGMGKSGLIGQKIIATLASTGTPGFFLHPAEAFHGDLGMIGKEDVVILLSYSGETDEILKIVPFLKWQGNKLIAITGNNESTLAKHAHYHLNGMISKEACPLQLAPTTSTTALLAMGDALAVALMRARDFKPQDFARFHPGGSLGKMLLAKVGDHMRKYDLPFLAVTASVHDLILRLSEGKLGLVIVVNNKNELVGVITDGDLRRALQSEIDIARLNINSMVTRKPVIVAMDTPLHDAEQLMFERKISTLLVGDDKNIVGVLQLYQMGNAVKA